MTAAAGGDTVTVNELLARGALVNEADIRGETPLIYAARYGAVRAAEELVRAGADITRRNTAGETALEIAIKSNHPETAAYLSSIGAP
jgi:ankyrin repeat protein